MTTPADIERALALLSARPGGTGIYAVPFGYLVPVGRRVVLPHWYDPVQGIEEFVSSRTSYGLPTETHHSVITCCTADGVTLETALWFAEFAAACTRARRQESTVLDAETGEEYESTGTRRRHRTRTWHREVCVQTF